MEKVQITNEQKETLAEILQEVIPNIKNTITFEDLINFQSQGD